MDDSLIFGEGVAGVINNKDVADSPFRLTTTTSNHEEVCKFSLLSTGMQNFILIIEFIPNYTKW